MRANNRFIEIQKDILVHEGKSSENEFQISICNRDLTIDMFTKGKGFGSPIQTRPITNSAHTYKIALVLIQRLILIDSYYYYE